MALVRVYCGLASTQAGDDRSDPAGPWLTVAVVDDSGRLLDVCGITDDPAGYVELGAVLTERSGGFSSVAVAADHDEHTVTMLLAAAGRALAIADDDSLDDYAERFGDDESAEELHAPLAERRAIGLARALQAGVLAATVQGAPRELLALKPVLAAHGALATGRQGAAAALREVLRELYPAALRAYPDPTAPIPLAILDALPEPGLLGGGAPNRSRDAAVIAELADAGLADANRISDAVTALRVAIAETPRRTGIGKTLTTAVAETIQNSVAAVRAFDSAIGAVVGLLTEKATPAPGGMPRPGTQPAPLRAVPEPQRPAAPRRPARAGSTAPTSGAPMSEPLPTRPTPLPTRPVPAREDYPAASHAPAPVHAPVAAGYGAPGPSAPPAYSAPAPSLEPPAAYGIPAPRLSPEVPAPGSRDDWPLNSAAQSARSGEFPLVVDPLKPNAYPGGLLPLGEEPPARPVASTTGTGRIAPPWLADDLPEEPAMLRLVEPAPLSDPALRDDRYESMGRRDDGLLGGDRLGDRGGRAAPSLRLIGGSAPVEDESDGDLLIFSQIQSAWFSDMDDLESPSVTWDDNPADAGWAAAERAASPLLGEATTVGLPRRVPQANLVPGSALPPQRDRGLRVVRDPAAMAAHTTGYFRGSRRGEEVRGFSIGGRPGRESAGGWDFSRDSERDGPYEYRSAARR